MLFVTTVRMRTEIDEEFHKELEELTLKPPKGVDFHELFYTLGRYDIIMCYEAPSEKEALTVALFFADRAATETSVAIPLEEASQLLSKHTREKREPYEA